MSILMNTWPIGIALALLTLGPLAQGVSWQAAFVATAGLAALGIFSVSFGYTPTPGEVTAQQVDLGSLTRREWLLVSVTGLTWMFYNAAYNLLVAFLPTYFVRSGLSIVSAGAMAALNTILSIVSIQFGGLLARQYGRTDLIVHLSLAGWALALIGLLTSGAMLPWIIVSGLIAGVPVGVFISRPGEVLRAKTRSTGMGVFYTIFYVGMAIVPPLAGAMSDRTASSAVPIWFAAACIAVCAGTHALGRSLQRSLAEQAPMA
jgi:cyanate permease